ANVEALGPIEYVVIPNAFHRLDGPRYASRYPGAKIIAPRGGRKKISEVVRVDLTADEFPSDADVALLPLEGVRGRENVLRVRSDDGVTLVFNDAVFNVPHQKGFGGLVLRLMGSSGGPRTTPLARFTLYDNKSAARHGLEAFADTPNLVRIVPGHGDVVTENAPAVLRQVATTL
ncbi:MAG: hypothetical protein ACO3JL_10565, partial [Myxococcota bacterium]